MRIAVAAGISAALLVPLGIFGGTGLAQSSAPAASQYKITICHHTHSKKHPTVTIRISIKAWPAHRRHGDTMNACPGTVKHAKHAAAAAAAQHAHQAAKGKSGSAPGHAKSGNSGASNGQGQSGEQHGQGHGHGK